MNSKIALGTAFCGINQFVESYRSVYLNINDAPHSADKQAIFLEKAPSRRFERTSDVFENIPENPLSYWLKGEILAAFKNYPLLSTLMELKAGMSTGNNDRFQRLWHEVSFDRISFNYQDHQKFWVPCNSGGDFRSWFGNNWAIVNWDDRGLAIRKYRNSSGNIASAIRNEPFYFQEGITWTKISLGVSARWMEGGFAFDDTGRSGFITNDLAVRENLLAVMLSEYAHTTLRGIASGVTLTSGELGRLPIPCQDSPTLRDLSARAVQISKRDWDLFERSTAFSRLELLQHSRTTIRNSYANYERESLEETCSLQLLEREINRTINRAVGIDGLDSEAPIEKVTLTVNPAYRYGVKGTEEERNTRFREDSMGELISYAIGCMMGRYSLDEPGLIYANSGNEGFDASRYTKFPADDDGIIPLTDKEWFSDDAANRLVEFISVAWPSNSESGNHLEENLNFLAANLSPKKGEDSRDTIRSYLCDRFYKDHLQTYKKRPIYWLFSSGKQKAFQCLVYLHRYNESTLARMRTEYVIPLTAKLSAHIDNLESDKLASDSAAEIKKLEKDMKTLQKQQTELTEFDDKLKHFADMRIPLDLDDGVKVNYGKFGDLLADVKAIHGEIPKESL
jgi:hypothetical protein